MVNDYDKESQSTRHFEQLEESLDYLAVNDSITLLKILQKQIEEMLEESNFNSISVVNRLSCSKQSLENSLKLLKEPLFNYREFEKAYDKVEEALVWLKTMNRFYDDHIDNVEIDGTQLKVKV